MQEKITTLIDDFQQMFARIPNEADRIKPAHVRVLADLGSVIATELLLKHLPAGKTETWKSNNKTEYSLEDSIVEEITGAEQKFMEYMKHQDPTLLNMAKDELRHAAYYLSQAKMTHDQGLLQRLKDYQVWYNNVEEKLNKNYQ